MNCTCRKGAWNPDCARHGRATVTPPISDEMRDLIENDEILRRVKKLNATTLREPVTTAPSFPTPRSGLPWEADDPAETVGGGGLAERRLPTEPDGGQVPGRRSLLGRWYADLLLEWSRTVETHGLTFGEWRRTP